MKAQRRIDHRALLADAVTPIGVYLAVTRARGGPSFLLESALGAGVGARRSMIGVGARGEVRAFDGEVSIAMDGGDRLIFTGPPLEACRALQSALQPGADDVARSPFLGFFGAAAHELSGYFERLPRVPRERIRCPICIWSYRRHLWSSIISRIAPPSRRSPDPMAKPATTRMSSRP